MDILVSALIVVGKLALLAVAVLFWGFMNISGGWAGRMLMFIVTCLAAGFSATLIVLAIIRGSIVRGSIWGVLDPLGPPVILFVSVGLLVFVLRTWGLSFILSQPRCYECGADLTATAGRYDADGKPWCKEHFPGIPSRPF